MKGIQIITNGAQSKKIQKFYSCENICGAEKLYFSSTSTTGFKGFGVAITGASCYMLNEMKPNERKELLNKIYSKGGLGLSVARISIGSSDYSAELYSYDDVPFDTELKHFSVERDEKYIIPMIKQILEINPQLYILASPWSPPGWMKTGGLLCGGYMRMQYVECYAEYIVKFIKAYAAHGIKISAITPQNEPNTQQAGRMPACIWHPEIEAEFIKILKKKLTENRLDVEIWMFDHNFNDTQRVIWQLKNVEGLADNCDGVAYHYYTGRIEDTKALKKEFPRIAKHFTEGGPRLYDNYETDWCKWGIMMTKALSNGFSSFIGWNLMLNEVGAPNIGPFGCGGLITRDSQSGELSFSGQYTAFSSISPYITPDSKIRALSVGEEFGDVIADYPKSDKAPCGFLIENGDEKICVVVNPNNTKKQVQLEIDETLWYAELDPDSISTFI